MMTDFSRLALVWGDNAGSDVSDTGVPHGLACVTVSAWNQVTDRPWQRWSKGYMPDLSAYDTFLVNLFADGEHIRQLRHAYPSAYIIACPDPSLDIVLMSPQWSGVYDMMMEADLIGGRTVYDCHVYGTLLNKPTVWLPSPIGPTDYFTKLRGCAKEDYILTLDHTMLPAAEVHNIAAVAAVQSETGLRVIYIAARDHTPRYGGRAGLIADYRGSVPFDEMIELTAHARLCIDLYARHSYGRQQVLAAMVGTPCVGSRWCCPTGHPQVEPFDTNAAVVAARNLLNKPDFYRQKQESGYRMVDAEYSFAACRERLARIMEDSHAHRVLSNG